METIKREFGLFAFIVLKIGIWFLLFEGIVYLDKKFNALEKAGLGPLQNLIFIFAVPTLLVILFSRMSKKIK